MKTLKTMTCVIAFTCAIASGMPMLASAQAPATPDAVGPAASQLPYDSAFAGYHAYQDVPVADWRRVNDTVREAAAKNTGQSGDSPADPHAGAARTSAGNAERPALDKEQDKGRGRHGGHQ